MKETNLSLFENFEPKNNVSLSKEIETKKRKCCSLFIILNGEKADFAIEEIFDHKKFNSIKAVTFSLDSSFINKYLSGFENVNLIIGIPDVDVQMRGLEAFRNIIDANKKMLKREQITFFESLSRENQENVLERKWEIKVPLKFSIHCKFYLLESETEKRLIIGSANLSNQAFSEKSSQYENIVIFDNDDSIFENYNEYFEFLKEECMDFIPNLFIKKTKKIKILNEKNATVEELEKAVPINFTFSETEGLMTEVAKDFFEKFSNNFLELDKEETEKEGGIIEQMKSIKSHYDTREKEIEKEKQFEKGSYEIVNDYISSRKVSKQKNVLTKPLKFAERIKEKIKLKTAPKIKEHVSDREKMILRENDMSDTDSGLYLIEKVTKTDENGKEIETQETRRFGRSATDEEIKDSIENIFHLIKSYEKYVPRYDADYGSRIIEAILYSFSTPFLQELRKRIAKKTKSTKELNIPMFMFLGGDSHSRKTTLTKLIGNYASIDPGVNNLVTMVDTVTKNPVIINGRPLKSINQWYNKKIAEMRSETERLHGKHWSHKMSSVTNRRNNKIKDYMHKASAYIVNHLVSNRIGTLIIGESKEWKQDTNMYKINNQNFVCIPFEMLKSMLEYKCRLAGIEVVRQEETYTSKCSFLDNEEIRKHEKYKGIRSKRGCFKTSSGRKVNADVNSACNIMKKYLLKVAGNCTNLLHELVEVFSMPCLKIKTF